MDRHCVRLSEMIMTYVAMNFRGIALYFWCPVQDAEVANMYKMNRETYNQTAKFWTETYAQVRLT